MAGLDDLQALLRDSGATWEAGDTGIEPLFVGTPDPDRFGLAVTEDDLASLRAQGESDELEFGLLAGEVSIPEQVDWRESEMVQGIYHQGSCQACVAFATCATLEARIRIVRNDPGFSIDLSEADLFFGGGCTCAAGWQFESALARARDAGIGLESAFPFTGSTQPPISIPPVVKVTSWITGVTPEARKLALATNGPVIAGLDVHADLYHYVSGVYRVAAPDFQGRHAVCIVGYDDSESCWIVKNSWGTNWGEAGYLRIGYGECGIDTTYAFFDPSLTHLDPSGSWI